VKNYWPLAFERFSYKIRAETSNKFYKFECIFAPTWQAILNAIGHCRKAVILCWNISKGIQEYKMCRL